MARPSRCTIPGRLHYVAQAGGGDVFLCEEDCLDYLGALSTVASREGVAVAGYALLPQEARLLLVPSSSAGLSRCMQELSRRFVRAFNARHAHMGTVWRDRYRACPIGPGLELEACHYLERFPEEEGLAVRPWLYLWSSAAHHAGVRADVFLSSLPAFEALGEAPPLRAGRWRAILEAPLPAGFGERLELSARRGRPFSSDVPGRGPRTPKG